MNLRIRGERILRAVSREAWAILPEKLDDISAFLSLRADGSDVSDEEVRAVLAERTSDRQPRRAAGVAVLPLTGTLLKRATAMEESSGVSSLERWGRAFSSLVANPDIGTIIVQVDSPGGTVGGTPEVAQLIYDARESKRVIAIADSLMASAAYWIGSAASEVVAAPSAEVGSIGVFSLHFDMSAYAEKLGVKATIVKFGEHKAEANQFEPLSETAAAHMQATVNTFGNQFVKDVARYRGTTSSNVIKSFGDGRVFTAQQAKDAGMVDRVASLDQVLDKLGISPAQTSARALALEAEQRRDDEEWAAEDSPERVAAEIRERHEPVLVAVAADLTMEPVAPAAAVETLVLTPDAADAAGDIPMEGTATAPAPAAPVTVAPDGIAIERKRIQDIRRIGAEQSVPSSMIDAAIEQGMAADNFERFAKITNTKENGPVGHVPTPPVDLTRGEQSKYSVVRAILAAADNDWSHAGFEAEVQSELRKKIGGKARGGRGTSVLIPTHLGSLPREYQLAAAANSGMLPTGFLNDVGGRPQATLTTGGTTSGKELVYVDPGSFIELLRNRLVCTAMGATFLPGLQGNVDFPKQTGAGTFSWRAEAPGTDVPLSDLVTGHVVLTPRDGTSRTSYSRRLLAQSVINVEQLVRNDLARIAALGVDFAALHGAGGNAPLGIYGQSGVNVVAFAGNITYAKTVAMETQILADNADIGSMGYVTTPEVRGNAKTTLMFPGVNAAVGVVPVPSQPGPIWSGGRAEGEMNGYRSLVSNQISKTLGAGSPGAEHGIIFGVWEHLLIGEWGAIELIVDPYTLAGQGLIVLTIFLIADVAVRYPECFCKGTGLTVTAP